MDRILELLRIGVLAFLLSACGDSDSGTTPTPDPKRATTIEIISSTDPVLLTEIGASVALQARVLDQSGSVISGVTVSWSSTAPSVASVDANGLVSAVAQGEASIQAQASGVTAQISLLVDTPDAPVGQISAPLDSASFLTGSSVGFRLAVSDADEGDTASLMVEWTSDLQGVIGVLTEFDRPDLVEGSHLISVVVTDRTGLADTSRVSVRVRAPQEGNQAIDGALQLDPTYGFDPGGLVASSTFGESAVGADGTYRLEVGPSEQITPVVFAGPDGDVLFISTIGGPGSLVPDEASSFSTALSLMSEQLRGLVSDADLAAFYEALATRPEVLSIADQIENGLRGGRTLSDDFESIVAAIGESIQGLVSVEAAAVASTGANEDPAFFDPRLDIRPSSDNSSLLVCTDRSIGYGVSVHRRQETATGWSNAPGAPIVEGAAVVQRGDWTFDAAQLSIKRKCGPDLTITIPEGDEFDAYSVLFRPDAIVSVSDDYSREALEAAKITDFIDFLSVIPVPVSCLAPFNGEVRREVASRQLSADALESLDAEAVLVIVRTAGDRLRLSPYQAVADCGKEIAQFAAKKVAEIWLTKLFTTGTLGAGEFLYSALLQRERLADKIEASQEDVCWYPAPGVPLAAGDCMAVGLSLATGSGPDGQSGPVGVLLPEPLVFRAQGALSGRAAPSGTFELTLVPTPTSGLGGLSVTQSPDALQNALNISVMDGGLSGSVWWAPTAEGDNTLLAEFLQNGIVHDGVVVTANGMSRAGQFVGDWGLEVETVRGPDFQRTCTDPSTGQDFTCTAYDIISQWDIKVSEIQGSSTQVSVRTTLTTDTFFSGGVPPRHESLQFTDIMTLQSDGRLRAQGPSIAFELIDPNRIRVTDSDYPQGQTLVFDVVRR